MRARNRSVQDLLAVAFLLIPTILTFVAFFNGLQHTLERHGGWESTKVSLHRPVMGSTAYVSTPVALAGEALNLAAWHGFQEVFTSVSEHWKEVGFQATMGPKSFFSLGFGDPQEGYQGIRFSLNPHLPSARFEVDEDGRFLAYQPIVIEGLKEGANTMRLDFGQERLRLTVNGLESPPVEDDGSESRRLGFRGGIHDVLIDDISWKVAHSNSIGGDSFTRGAASISLILLTGLCLIFFVFIIARRAGRKATAQGLRYRSIHYALATTMILLFLGGSLYSLDRLFLSRMHGYSASYFKLLKTVTDLETRIETKDEASERLARTFAQGKKGNATRILFIGSSQTWGAGTKHEGGDLVTLVEQALRQGGRTFECANTGISGAKSEDLYIQYERHWVNWKPDIVVINLGNNDRDATLFASNLERFITLNQTHSIRTVFIKEANAPDTPRTTIFANHRAMEALGESKKISVIDMHQFLYERRLLGFLWWDFVHLSDFGQQLAAGHIAAELLRISPRTPIP